MLVLSDSKRFYLSIHVIIDEQSFPFTENNQGSYVSSPPVFSICMDFLPASTRSSSMAQFASSCTEKIISSPSSPILEQPNNDSSHKLNTSTSKALSSDSLINKMKKNRLFLCSTGHHKSLDIPCLLDKRREL